MSSHLLPCPGCSRHIRASSEACPFCAQSLAPELRASAAPSLPKTRLSRTALVAWGLATSLGVAACGGDDDGPSGGTDSGMTRDSGGGGTDSGTPDEDSGTPDEDSGTPDEDSGTPPVDGGPGPVDSGTDSGSPVPPYGAPAYGAPPDPPE